MEGNHTEQVANQGVGRASYIYAHACALNTRIEGPMLDQSRSQTPLFTALDLLHNHRPVARIFERRGSFSFFFGGGGGGGGGVVT